MISTFSKLFPKSRGGNAPLHPLRTPMQLLPDLSVYRWKSIAIHVGLFTPQVRKVEVILPPMTVYGRCTHNNWVGYLNPITDRCLSLLEQCINTPLPRSQWGLDETPITSNGSGDGDETRPLRTSFILCPKRGRHYSLWSRPAVHRSYLVNHRCREGSVRQLEFWRSDSSGGGGFEGHRCQCAVILFVLPIPCSVAGLGWALCWAVDCCPLRNKVEQRLCCVYDLSQKRWEGRVCECMHTRAFHNVVT